MDVACIGGSAVEGCIDALELRDASLELRRDRIKTTEVITGALLLTGRLLPLALVILAPVIMNIVDPPATSWLSHDRRHGVANERRGPQEKPG